jgi:hypothetical protein
MRINSAASEDDSITLSTAYQNREQLVWNDSDKRIRVFPFYGFVAGGPSKPAHDGDWFLDKSPRDPIYLYPGQAVKFKCLFGAGPIKAGYWVAEYLTSNITIDFPTIASVAAIDIDVAQVLVPFDFVLTDVVGSVVGPPTTQGLEFSITVNGTPQLTTNATIDVNENSTVTAAVAAVINPTERILSKGDIVQINVEAEDAAASDFNFSLIGHQRDEFNNRL